MTLAHPAAPEPVDTTVTPAVEPTRFDAYAAGSEPERAARTDRVLALVQRMLVPRLSRTARGTRR